MSRSVTLQQTFPHEQRSVQLQQTARARARKPARRTFAKAARYEQTLSNFPLHPSNF